MPISDPMWGSLKSVSGYWADRIWRLVAQQVCSNSNTLFFFIAFFIKITLMFTLHSKAMETLLGNLDITLNWCFLCCCWFFFLMLKSQSGQTKINQGLGLISGTSEIRQQRRKTLILETTSLKLVVWCDRTWVHNWEHRDVQNTGLKIFFFVVKYFKLQ